MAQVLITDTKLDSLAQGIATKSGATLPLTLDQMITEVSGIPVASNDTWSWMGKNPTHISQFHTLNISLADTSFSTWTPSTTSAKIKDTITTTYSADMDNYDYYVRWLYDINFAYTTSDPVKGNIIRYFGAQWQELQRRPYSTANFATMTDIYNYNLTALAGSMYVLYINSSGARTWSTTTAYGIVPVLTANTFSKASGTGSNTPTITLKSPQLYARCSGTATSYFTTTVAGRVDASGTTIKIRGDLYRVDKNTSDLKAMYNEALYVYNNPLV